MNAKQNTIDAVIAIYNEVTRSHKRAPVEAYVHKQLSAGETVEMLSGYPRWSSALRFSGTPEDMQAEFVINSALPQAFQDALQDMQQRFEQELRTRKDL